MNFPTKTNMTKRNYYYVNTRLPGPNKPAFSFWRKKKTGAKPEPVDQGSAKLDIEKAMAAVETGPPKVNMHKVKAALAALGR